jgi:putative membrane-bound dehydrogenase-like protein
MRICVRIGAVLIVLLLGLGGICPATTAESSPGFTPLFNGKDLEGWSGDDRLWRVEDGVIIGSTKGVKIEANTFLICEKPYGDFVLRVKTKLDNHNSGIQFRSERLPNHAAAGYQADIAEKTYFGMLYEERKRGFMPYWGKMTPEQQAEIPTFAKQGEWNQFEITCEGDRIKMVLNGHTTCDINDPDGAKEGIIALQLHAGPEMKVSFKDIEIRELEPSAKLIPDFDDVERRDLIKLGGQRWRVPPGFVVEEVAPNDMISSIVNMTFDHLGRPALATEGGGIKLLMDDDGDGSYDRLHSFCEEIDTAHGMHYIGPGDLLVNARGPEPDKVTALYRLTDTDGDDVADEVTMIMKSNGGIGEHGPHTIMTGPDGYLYVLYGNHAHPSEPDDPASPLYGLDEDNLLPRYVDPRGHANNIRAPAGTMHRLSPDLKTWRQIVGGYRNPFDMAMDVTGEIFTFDSDMEWDRGLPWFRPIRVIHAVPGGDYGWRTGSAKMPDYYIDTLPGVDGVGRGSPVGVAFYYHNAYPEKFRGALFMGDWSRGRIRVIFPEKAGATYAGETDDFIVGEPLNVTDLDVGPDGNLYFTIGGRRTTGGLYRVRYTGTDIPANRDGSEIDAIVRQPMPRSAWGKFANANAKEALGEDWEAGLTDVVFDGERPSEERLRALEALQLHGPEPDRAMLGRLTRDEDATLRAQATFLLGAYPLTASRNQLVSALNDEDPTVIRRAAEALVRSGLSANDSRRADRKLARSLVKLLNHDDRFVRYSSHQALRRVQRSYWEKTVLKLDIANEPRAAMEGLLALVLTAETAEDSDAIFDRLGQFADADMTDDVLLQYTRVISLAQIRDKGEGTRNEFKDAVGPALLDRFPSQSREVNRELQVLAAYTQAPGAQAKLLAYLTPDKPQEEQIHTVYCLRVMEEGWDHDQRDQLVAWFDTGREIGGAASMAGYIDNLWNASMELMPDEQRAAAEGRKQAALDKRNADAIALLAKLDEEAPKVNSDLAQMSFEELAEYLEYDPMNYREPNLKKGENVFIRARCANCHVFGDIGFGGGPDLSSVVSRFRRRDILESIMYPSQVVSDQYQAYHIELADFSDVSGMLAGETDSTLTLITTTGEKVDIAKSEITSQEEVTTSVMPEGLLNTMSMGDLVSLIQFLETGNDE